MILTRSTPSEDYSRPPRNSRRRTVGTVTAMLGFLVSVIGTNPTENVVFDRVDMMEVNHFYDEHGRLVFDQVIFYDWSAADSHYHVRAWRLLKNPTQLPA